MEQQTNSTKDRPFDDYDSLRRQLATRLSRDKPIKREYFSPDVRIGPGSVKRDVVLSNANRNDENASGSTLMSVDRRLVSTYKRSVHTGPLKKRSPKPSPAKKKPPDSPDLTPHSAIRPPLLRRFEGGFYQYPVQRNRNNELANEAIFTTPKATSSSTRVKPTTAVSYPKQTPSVIRLTPFSSSKKRKTSKPVVTNVSKYQPASAKENRHVSDFRRIHRQTLEATNADSRSHPVNNVLRIIHPFGSNPRASIESIGYTPASSTQVPMTPTKKREQSSTHLRKRVSKINQTRVTTETKSKSRNERNATDFLFSPILRPGETSNTPTTDDVKGLQPAVLPMTNTEKTREKELENLLDRKPLCRPDLFRKVRITKTPCKCKKTNCLKLYCECFHNNSFCHPKICSCKDCMNTQEHNRTDRPRGARVRAMLVTMERKPFAFDGGGRKFNKNGCRCSKSR